MVRGPERPADTSDKTQKVQDANVDALKKEYETCSSDEVVLPVDFGKGHLFSAIKVEGDHVLKRERLRDGSDWGHYERWTREAAKDHVNRWLLHYKGEVEEMKRTIDVYGGRIEKFEQVLAALEKSPKEK